jgi:uncharacterized protein involved in outer membrane biogenesis
MKKLLIILLLLAGGAFAAIYFGIGGLIKAGVEKGGSTVLDTETKLESAHLNPLAGSLVLNGLSIANPPGFKQNPTFAVGSIGVAVDTGSLSGDTIKIETIDIVEPEIGLEISTGGTNFGKLLEIVKSKTGGGATKPDEPAADDGKPGTKMLIKKIRITKAKLTVAQSVLMSTSQSVVLKDIELNDVGSDSKPADFGAMLQQIFTAILNAAAENPELKLPADLQNILKGDATKFVGDLQKQADELKNKVLGDAQKQVDDIKKQGQDAVDEAKKKADELKEGLGGLLGGKKN